MFHIFGPRYPNSLKPQLAAFTDSNWKSVCERRLYPIYYYLKNTYIIGAARFSFVWYSSVANILRFLTGIVTKLFFSRSFFKW